MSRTRIALAVSLALLASASAHAAGNGPYAMVVCHNPTTATGTVNCQANPTITDAASLAAALTPPAAAFSSAAIPVAFPFVHSWPLGREINFYSYTSSLQNIGIYSNNGTSGILDIDDRSLMPGNTSATNAPQNFAKVFSGWIEIPVAGADTIKTFAIGSNDGMFFAIQSCTQGATTCADPAAAVVTASDITGGHALDYNASGLVKVVFPAAGGKFPFQLVTYNLTGNSALEFGWADGDQTASPPTFNGGNNTWSNPGGFVAVPPTSIYAPDVHATLSATSASAPDNDVAMTFTASISNRGSADAWPAASADGGLTYTLMLPVAQFQDTGHVGTVQVNGGTVTCTTGNGCLTANATNVVVTVKGVKSTGVNANNVLFAGGTATVSVVATIRHSGGNTGTGNTFDVQGVVAGHATDPTHVITGQAVAPANTFFVYTNDPSTTGDTVDEGNLPAAMTGATPESAPTTTVTLITAAQGEEEDDPMQFAIGTVTNGTPVITAFSGDKVSSLSKTTLAGTSAGLNPVSLKVTLSTVPAGFGQTQCNAAGGKWSWDSTANMCTCFTSTTANAWSCTAIALTDCPAASNCYTASAVVGDSSGDTAGTTANYAFRVVAPTVTQTLPATGTVPTHAIPASGSVTDNLGGSGPGAGKSVTVNGTGPGSPSCSNNTNAGNAYSCTLNVTQDGAWTVSASIAEANGTVISSSTSTVTANTKPAITALSAHPLVATNITNDNTPNVSGTTVGDGPNVKVCDSSDVGCASALCTTTNTASAFACNTSALTPDGSRTLVAYEVDAGGHLGAASDPITVVVNTTKPTLTSFPSTPSKTFNLGSNPGTVGGACFSGEAVTATLNNTAAPANANCTATCTSSAWSCAITVPSNDTETGLHIHVAQAGTDQTTVANAADTTGFTVDTQAPAAVVLNAIANVGAAGPNPPAVGGTGENGAAVTLTASGTLRGGGGPVSATCTSNPVPSGGGHTWSCTTWDVVNGAAHTSTFPDGSYTATAFQTDSDGNPQTAANATQTFQVRQALPPMLSVVVPALIGAPGTPPSASGGSAENGDTLTVVLKDHTGAVKQTCTQVLSADGAWTCSSWSPGGTLAEDSYTAEATQKDTIVNNTSLAGTQAFIVDKTAPGAPSLASANVAAGGYTPNRSPVITATAGTADPGAKGDNRAQTVSIHISDGTNCNALPTSAAMTCTPAAPLADGAYTATATQTDAAGNISAASTTFSFNVDGTTSLTPVLTQPTSPTNTAPTSLTGTGYPASAVTVSDAAGTVCTSVTVAADKSWTCTPAGGSFTNDGDYVLTATGHAPNGSGDSASRTLKIRSLAAPTLTGPASTIQVKPSLTISGVASGETVTVFDGATSVCVVPSSPGATATCSGTQWSSALAIGDHSLTAERGKTGPTKLSFPSTVLAVAVLPTTPALANAGTFGTTQPLLSFSGGTGLAALTVTDDATSATVCSVTAAADGSASCQLSGTTVLANGAHALTVHSQLNGKSNSASAGSVTIDATPSLGTDEAALTKNASPQLCVGPRPNVPGGTTATVSENGSTVCTVSVDANASQACCHPSSALSDGAHSMSATLTFPPGGKSDASSLLTLTIKTHTEKPVFSSPTEGTALSGDVVLTGTAEAGDSVAVSIDSAALPAAATADASGKWSVNAGVLATGAHTAKAVATDSLGNTATSDTRNFSIGIGGHVEGSGLGCSSTSGSGVWALAPLLALALLRRRRAAVLAAVLCAAAGARAEDVGLDHFRPASGSDGTIGVEGARPPSEDDAPLEVHLLGMGQNKPLVFVPDNGGPSTALIRNRVGGWLGAQLHLGGPLSAVVQLPFLLGQHGDLSALPPDLGGGGTLGGGLGDVRATVRLGLLRQEHAFLDLSVQASVELPTASSGQYLGNHGIGAEGLAAVGHRIDLGDRAALDLIGNLYMRVAPTRTLLDVQAGNELGMRAALAWLPGSDSQLVPSRLMLEAEGASFLHAAFANGSVPAEWRAAVEYCAGPLAFDVGAGGGLAKGIGTPGLRLVGGVGFAPGNCGGGAASMQSRIARSEPPAPAPKPPPAVVQARPAPAPAPKPAPLVEKPAPKPAPFVAAPPLPAPKQEPLALPPLPLPAPPVAIAKPAPAPAPAPAPKSEPPPLALPSLPALPLPGPAPAEKPKKKDRRVAQADVPPPLPGLDMPPLALPGAPLASIEGDHIALTQEPQFTRGKLRPASHAALDDVARLMLGHAEIAQLTIVAPQPEQAQAVSDYLRGRGVAASRLKVSNEPALGLELRISRR